MSCFVEVVIYVMSLIVHVVSLDEVVIGDTGDTVIDRDISDMCWGKSGVCYEVLADVIGVRW